MGRSPIVYSLNDPGFTIYHRAALGGLAASIRSWGIRGRAVEPPLSFDKDGPSGSGVLRDDSGRSVRASLDESTVTLKWEETTTDREALAMILKASFRRTDKGMIYLPGQGFGPEREDVQVAAHIGYSQTFLQHPKKRPGQGIESVNILDDDGKAYLFSYKKIDRYSHQTAQGTSLLGEGWNIEPGDLPEMASVSQSLLPGATGGAGDLAGAPEQVFLLHFLIVACPVFSIRSRKRESKTQNCIVVPDVSNLVDFSSRIENIGTRSIDKTNSYLGRVAGGAEEAAMRFLIDLRGQESVEELSVSGAQVYAMGKVPWDSNQQNRSWIAQIKLPSQYPGFAVFEAAAGTLGRAKIIKTKKGEPFAVPSSPLPDLIAANLASGGHWSDGFQELVAKKKDFVDLSYRREGLRAMNDAIRERDEEDRLVIRYFQKAWSMKMGSLAERSRELKSHFSTRADTERERIRNDLLRTKTADQLASWLMRFVADATRGGTPRELTENADALRKFIFNPRNVNRLKNLLLFALVSYAAPDAPEDPANAGED
jgi:CRISPR-associated protein Cas8a1/Csx13